LGFRVGVWGLGFGVWGLGFRVRVSGFGLGFRVYVSGFRAQILRCADEYQGLRVRNCVPGRFRVSGFGFRVYVCQEGLEIRGWGGSERGW
jgi:hypothetical protein